MATAVDEPTDAALTLSGHGARLLAGAANAILDELDALAAELTAARAGQRLEGNAVLSALTAEGALLQRLAAEHVGNAARAVRAILFDKSAETNWALGWHQDRTIAVANRHDVTGFGPWTTKSGMTHVAPPFALLARMLTMRVHIDPVPRDNAPLLIAPGSHRAGLVREKDIAETIARYGSHACLAERGDVWIYATSILHASERATAGRHRRVLQIDFSADELPSPLAWRGI